MKLYFFLVLMFMKLLFCRDDHNRMANLMLAAELQLFRLGVPLSQLNCHSQWRVKLIDCFYFATTVTYSYTIMKLSTKGLYSKITIWYWTILVTIPLIYRVVLMVCFSQELMLIYRRIFVLNKILEKLLARERSIVTNNFDQMERNNMQWLN